MGSLSQLPPELCSIVLEGLGSSLDLYKAIKSSSRLARVFWRSPERYLAQILRNSISQTALPFALALVYAPRLPQEGPDKSKRQHRQIIESFLANLHLAPRKLLPTEKADLVLMIRCHNRITRFLRHFAALALFKSNKATYIVDSLPWWTALSASKCQNAKFREDNAIQDLSCSERARFERGFYLYELYCQTMLPWDVANFRANPAEASLFSAREQFNYFLLKFPPYQVEEVSCVYQYLLELGGQMFDVVEDQFIDELLLLANDEQSLDCEGSLYEFKVKDLTVDTMDEFEYRYLSGFTRGNEYLFRLNSVHYAVSLGLDYLYGALQSTDDKLREVIRRSQGRTRNFLWMAVASAPLIAAASTLYEEDDDPSHPNLGWFECKPTDEDLYIHRINNIWHFRQRGMAFVFWDVQRLREGGILIKLQSPVNEFYDEPPPPWPRAAVPSDEVFENIIVPMDKLYELVGKYVIYDEDFRCPPGNLQC